MKLDRFRVKHFRSVMDSGWISCDDVTTLVGINESGKSNILLALWKLNPARSGKIDYLHDLPVTELAKYEKTLDEVYFIEAIFTMADSADYLGEKLGIAFNVDNEFYLSRRYDGVYTWHFTDEALQSDVMQFIKRDKADEDDEETDENILSFTKKELFNMFFKEVPHFVYYSNYGNLTSKIYLPHVIKWLAGEEITGVRKNDDQLRTIKVLFEYVGLEPEEILEYGRDAVDIARERNRNNTNPEPTEEEIEKAREDKEKRSLLLQSAGTKLSSDFRNWWKQGEYKLRFQADGDYFQIWVSDSIRTEEVDLELRSTGLQWFLSFYLIFLVESQEDNKGAVLLLDEAGLTLHPLAQKDLAAFFIELSKSNQIINTTHSPFIVDTENIDRCRVVYSDESGYTVVSDNLREGAKDIGEKSVYAVHAALGLSVSDVILQGCQPVIVEGISDQFYLSSIKNVLLREGKIKPSKEIIFIPSGGVKGVSGISSIVSSKNDDLPFVILDSDSSGESFKKKLVEGIYRGESDRVLAIKSYTSIESSEIEDIVPYELIEKGVDRLFGVQDDDFEPDEGKPIVPQIEEYAEEHNITLKKGWKVDLAKEFKRQISSKKKKSVEEAYLKEWTELFETFC